MTDEYLGKLFAAAYERALEQEESIFTSWLMGLLDKPHSRALEEDEARSAAQP